MKGHGLGIKIEPLEEPGLNYKQKGRVYLIRGVGIFTPENQMKDLGLRTINSAMKDILIE